MTCRIDRIDVGPNFGRERPTSVDEHGRESPLFALFTEHGRDHTTNRRRGYDGASSGTLTHDDTGGDPMGWFP